MELYPVFVYKKLFNRTYIQFLKIHCKYLVISVLCGIITVFIVNNIKINNNFLQLILNGVIVIIVPNLIQYLIFHKTEEFKYVKEMLAKVDIKNKFRRSSN